MYREVSRRQPSWVAPTTPRILRMSTEGFSQGGREAELLRHIQDIVVELRPDGRIAYISPAVERILGRPPSYYTDLSFLEVVLPEDRLPGVNRVRLRYP